MAGANSSNATGGNDHATTTEKLSADCASFARVKSRLILSPNNKLPDILSKLLPRLLRRLNALERASQEEDGREDVDRSIVELRQTAITSLRDIFSNAFERIKDNETTSVVVWMEAILGCVLDFLEFDEPRQNPAEDEREGAPPQLRAVHEHNRERNRREEFADARENHFRQQLGGAVRPLVPVDGSATIGGSNENTQPPRSAAGWALALLQFGVTRLSRKIVPDSLMPTMIRVCGRLHRSVYDIRYPAPEDQDLLIKASWVLMDSIACVNGMRLYTDWDLGRFRGSDLDWRSSEDPVVASDAAIEAAAQEGEGAFRIILDMLLWKETEYLSFFSEDMFDARRARQKRKRAREFTNEARVYFCHLKLALLRYARALFRNRNDVSCGSRLQVLSTAIASEETEYGVLAFQILGHEKITSKSAHQQKKPRHESQTFSVLSTCALLCLVLGEEAVEGILGDFSSEPFYLEFRKMYGGIPTSDYFQRPPLSQKITSVVLSFLMKRPDSAVNSPGTNLLLALIKQLSKSAERGDAKYAAVVLFDSYFSASLSQNTHGMNEEAKAFGMQVLQEVVQKITRRPTSLRMASILPAFERQGEQQFARWRTRGLPHRPRQSGAELQARQSAYRMSVGLFRCSHISSTGTTMGGSVCDLTIPSLLFRAAICDENSMKSHAARALHGALGVIEESKRNPLNLHSVARLLPPILEAVGCDSTLVIEAALKWIDGVVKDVDAEAAAFMRLFSGEKTTSSDLKRKDAKGKSTSQGLCVNFIDTASADQTIWLRAALESHIRNFSEKTGLSFGAAAAVDFDFGFSSDALEEAWNECQENVLEGSGIRTKGGEVHDSQKDSVCLICYDDMIESSRRVLRCGHEFCNACYNEFITVASNEGGNQLLDLRCPQHGCDSRIFIDDLRLVPESCLRWEKAMVEDFVHRDGRFCWCPGPDCAVVVELSGPQIAETLTINCAKCATSFCNRCSGPGHEPSTCEHRKSWDGIFGDSTFWVKKNTKPCPGCNSPIEKNSGCNHMTCSKCKSEFCWLCTMKLDTHSQSHACVRYDPRSSADSDDEKMALFFTDRFTAHEDAIVRAEKQLKEFSLRIEGETDDVNALDDQERTLYRSAFEAIRVSRTFLMNCYVFVFGLSKSNDLGALDEFQIHQEVLEMFVERLSFLTEANIFEIFNWQGENGLKRHFLSIACFREAVLQYTSRVKNVVRAHKKREVRKT